MSFLYGDLLIILKLRNVKICEHSSFKIKLKLNLHCSSGFFNGLLIFKFRNSKFDLKDNFVNN